MTNISVLFLCPRIPLWDIDGNVCAWTIVDDTDFAWLDRWKWHLSPQGYAARTIRINGKRQKFLMHRFILGLRCGDPRQGDHINRNKLDNRRSNLRIAKRAELDNGQNLSLSVKNTSGFRGVSWDSQTKKWRAEAMVGGKRYRLGRFQDPEEAYVTIKAFRAKHMPFSEDAMLARKADKS
jgi:hypothetical protein